MTGREKIEAAFSSRGAPEFPVVICYPGICLRDHWDEVTDQPWWALSHPDPRVAAIPIVDFNHAIDVDWFVVRPGFNRAEQSRLSIELSGDRVFRVNRETGERIELERPPVSGAVERPEAKPPPPAEGVSDPRSLDRILDSLLTPDGGDVFTGAVAEEGRLDLPQLLVSLLGKEKMPLIPLTAPLWKCFSLWGFEGTMRATLEQPDLVEHAVRRVLDERIRYVRAFGRLGPSVVWIEDCWTDMISPSSFQRFNVEPLRELTHAIRTAGMWSVHYFCGDWRGKWDLLMETGADAIALEEPKKGFPADIADMAERVQGRKVLLGNLDAHSVLEKASDEQLRAEIARQMDAGRRNRGRFIMSLGSPVTPGTPISRVRSFCEIARELGRN